MILGRVAPNASAGDPNEQREEEWERKEEGRLWDGWSGGPEEREIKV